MGTVDLATTLCGMHLDPPLLLASGVLGETGPSLLSAIEGGAGGVVTKSICLLPREGPLPPLGVGRRRRAQPLVPPREGAGGRDRLRPRRPRAGREGGRARGQ